MIIMHTSALACFLFLTCIRRIPAPGIFSPSRSLCPLTLGHFLDALIILKNSVATVLIGGLFSQALEGLAHFVIQVSAPISSLQKGPPATPILKLHPLFFTLVCFLRVSYHSLKLPCFLHVWCSLPELHEGKNLT